MSEAAVRGGWWLAQASGDTARARLLWSQGLLAEIPIGIHFDVVRLLSLPLGQAAVEDLRAAGRRPGPVLLDHVRRYSFWLVAIERGEWGVPEAELLSCRAGRLPQAIPVPGTGVGRVGGREWLVEPDGTGLLTRPGDLAVAIRRARAASRSASGFVP
ncbi:hypothetical protein [Kitasatospora sp. NPDC056184]|uniref:hypothetical protein n=1 Tax=Kitasatospora sp. NPDC056184 TaxID=3345738 RepID=UPI0035DAF74B